MTRLLQFAGALVALIMAALCILLCSPLFAITAPFFAGFFLPLFAGTLGVIALSYGFAWTTTVGGAAVPGPFMNAVAAIYVVLCTPVLVWAVASALAFVVAFPDLFLIGLAALVLLLIVPAIMALVTYVLAATFAPVTAGIESPTECFFRGALIGANTALNGAFALVLYTPLFTQLASSLGSLGSLVALAVTLVTLATFMTILASATVAPAPPAAGALQALVELSAGWSSWLMPMSWAYCVSGWWEFYRSWAGHSLLLLLPGVAPAGWAIAGLDLSAEGDIGTTGGIGGSASQTAYNNGCFTFISQARAGVLATREHETGHHLHLAAFGSFFHWIDAVNENGFASIPGQGANAYGERIAESNLSTPRGRQEVQVWR